MLEFNCIIHAFNLNEFSYMHSGKQHLSSLNQPLNESESHSEQEMEKNLLFPQSVSVCKYLLEFKPLIY